MNKLPILPNLLAVLLFGFVMNVNAQEKTKVETVKESIDELIENIQHAADTIEHIDQINAIY